MLIILSKSLSFVVIATYYSFQSPDEIEKLYIDEKLSDFDRVSMLLGSQYDVQKIWAIRQIVSLLKTQEENTVTKLVPKVNVSSFYVHVYNYL